MQIPEIDGKLRKLELNEDDTVKSMVVETEVNGNPAVFQVDGTNAIIKSEFPLILGLVEQVAGYYEWSGAKNFVEFRAELWKPDSSFGFVVTIHPWAGTKTPAVMLEEAQKKIVQLETRLEELSDVIKKKEKLIHELRENVRLGS